MISDEEIARMTPQERIRKQDEILAKWLEDHKDGLSRFVAKNRERSPKEWKR